MARAARQYGSLVIIATLFYSGMNAFAATNESGVQTKWGYKGDISPAHWGQLSSSFGLCTTGRAQSPINIIKKVEKAPSKLTINYHIADNLSVVDDGTTNLTMGDNQLVIYDGHGLQLNFSKTKIKEFLELDGIKYHLVQLHFHSPSENVLRGQSFPLEIHLVHQSDEGKVAVIGVWVKGGTENPILKQIISHLPKDEHQEHLIEDERINPNDLLPVKRDYYHFTGSLTTPPCAEGVNWVVMTETITASPAQIAILRKAAGGGNARPVQPLNGRIIYLSSGNTP